MTKPPASPQVAIVMGSESDLETLRDAQKVLVDFEIPHTLRVISAHRTPERARAFALNAESNGLKVIIAAAGKAAHLAGVLAGMTALPVIGVPMKTSDLGGLDSLLSMVQMPGGVPVGTVAIGSAGARNAALLTIRILALSDVAIQAKLKAYIDKMAADVTAADERLVAELEKEN